MRHLFRATRMRSGIDDWISFDSSMYTQKEATTQFEEILDFNACGYPYTRYKYNGIDYRYVTYVGEFEEDKMPASYKEYADYLKAKHYPNGDNRK